jgi:MFS family permease
MLGKSNHMHPILRNFREIKNIKPLVIVSLGHGATHWVNGIFLVLLPFIVQDLSLSYTTAGTMVSIFFIAAVAITIISGPIIDITKKYITAQFSCLLSGFVALIIMGQSTSVYTLAIAAIFIGICVSGWHTPSIPYLSQLYEKNRGLALSIHTVGASLGDGIAPPIAGLIMLYVTWQETSMILSIPIIIMAIYITRSLPNIERDNSSEDLIRNINYLKELKVLCTSIDPIRFIPISALVMVPLMRLQTSFLLAIAMAIPIALLIEFSYQLLKRNTKYVEGVRGLIRSKDMLRLCLLAGLWSMTQNGVTVFLPLYLVFVMDASPALVGFALFSIQVGAIFGGPIVGTWSDQIGRKPIVIYALLIAAFLLFLLPLFGNVYLFIIIVSLAGCALYSIRPVIHSWTMDLSDKNSSGSAVSMLFTAQAAMTGTVPIIGGLIADNFGLKLVFILLTITSLLALILSLLMPKK